MPAKRRIPGGVCALGFVSLLMDVSSELIHSLLPVFLTRHLGATLLAVDGAVTDSVPRQFANLPEDATPLVVSVGGGMLVGGPRDDGAAGQGTCNLCSACCSVPPLASAVPGVPLPHALPHSVEWLLALLVLRATPAMGIVLAVHLGAVFALFLTLPYGKFVHINERAGIEHGATRSQRHRGDGVR